jgi:hypothetical protein
MTDCGHCRLIKILEFVNMYDGLWSPGVSSYFNVAKNHHHLELLEKVWRVAAFFFLELLKINPANNKKNMDFSLGK